MPYTDKWYQNLRNGLNLKNNEKCICFDVGSADGSEFLSLATKYNNITVYAFEPIPRQFNIINEKVKNLKNFNIYNLAASNYSGISEFNVCDNIHFRTSSLKKYDEKANDTWKNCWSGRFKNKKITDEWKFVDKIKVNVIKLDSFIKNNNINNIHYLHCDTQGNDYEVIENLIKYNKIEEGVIECCTFDDKPLYENQKSLQFIKKFLYNNNYLITKQKEQATDLTVNRGLETNLFFKLKK